MIAEADVERVRRWADVKNAEVPEALRDDHQIELRIDNVAITIIQREPPFPGGDEPFRVPIARLRYVAKDNVWRLYWVDADDKAHRYEPLPQARHVQVLLREIDEDPTGIFWG